MPVVERGLHHDTQVLLRQVDGLVALLRLRQRGLDPAAIEHLAEALRAMVVGSGSASAADRARVRATVHYYMLLASRGGLFPLPIVPAGQPASTGVDTRAGSGSARPAQAATVD
jgi:hypothetical protein